MVTSAAPPETAIAQKARRMGIPFVQGEDALTKKHEGTGLGLAISKRLVEQHGGTIEVATAVGRGSTFAFRIPAAEAEPAPAPAAAPVGPPSQLSEWTRAGRLRGASFHNLLTAL